MIKSPASLVWQDGQPYSARYGDVYFSRDSGLEETRHVFLAHNRLEDRWKTLQERHFTIAETGFGTGLNFLAAWQLWRKVAPEHASLHYVSTELFPLAGDELAAAIALWPELAEPGKQLLEQYHSLAPGWHRLTFEGGHVVLTLLIGDAIQTLPRLKASVDAWFLDGFAPAKNPGMWQQSLFDSMAKLSHMGTTFATFTSAGEVRRGLQSAGFEVSKVAGFGRKREMLCGFFAAGRQPPKYRQPSRAIVVGGGIAGTASAYALARRGWQVSLIERHPALASEASGNPLAMLYPRLSGQDINLSRLALNGYLFSVRLLQQLGLTDRAYGACGLLQLAFNTAEQARCEAVAARDLPDDLVSAVDAAQASQMAGIELNHAGLYFPRAGWVDPSALCHVLANQPTISLMAANEALRLERAGDSWQVWTAAGMLAEAPVVIVAAAAESARFVQTMHLPLEPVRGQISMANESSMTHDLKTVICTDGYISPAVHGQHCLGATFSPDETSTELRDADNLHNLRMLKHISPTLAQALGQQAISGRASLRAATPDYLPMAGPILDAVRLKKSPPRHTADPASLPWLDGLYVNTGHGSKGFINAPLCAEMIAGALCGEPAPVDSQLLAALDPNRFQLRKLGLKRLVQGLACWPVL